MNRQDGPLLVGALNENTNSAKPLKVNDAGELLVTGSGGSGSNAAAGPTGSAVPASADYQGVNVSGTLRGVTGVNPAGSVIAEQVDIASVGGTAVTVLPTVEAAPTTIFNGKTTVASAGTRVALASSTTVKSVTIKALAANTGTIYVGNSSVAAANGFALAARETVSMDIANLVTVNIDASVNGEGVTYIAVN